MRTLFIVLGIWLLINVLFVVIMIPPRRSRRANGQGRHSGLSPASIHPNSQLAEADEGFSLRHAIIAIALGSFFSLSPPLLQAYDAIAAFIRKLCRAKGATVKNGGNSGDSLSQ
ncbi:hypothetical protein [Bradyrhizobium monzae]|uniref:hypothetical protein n=1 Tax=Bradyrhizobium sp. Oc8 TaxID=2876780 RepID=UPI001F313718|nr:hypothetical protein [Bradyrhizobium sp. Oc8]